MHIIGHERIIQFFEQAITRGALTHAYLFSGPLSVGKTTLVEYVAKRMLCRAGSGDDECISCAAHGKGQHPDFSFIDPESTETPNTIPIDAVRSIESWARLKPIVSPIKIQTIIHADRLNSEAANALLKLCEDPPPHTVFFLTAEVPMRLPATLRSRMQRFRCTRIPRASMMTLLQARGIDKKRAEQCASVAHGCPGVALRCANEEADQEKYVNTIEHWLQLLEKPMSIFQFMERESERIDPRSFFMTGHVLLHDLLRLQWGVAPRILVSALDYPREQLLQRYPEQKLHTMSRALLHTMQLLRTNASSKLIIENFFVSLSPSQN